MCSIRPSPKNARVILSLMHSHDLSLPDWGPYTKKYMGVSHIADARRGWRFDLSVVPGFYRRKIDLPSVLWESGYHPWEASPDLSYFCHRHELEWRDQVYCDIAFAWRSEASRWIRCECVNRTGAAQGLVLHLLASLQFPKERPSAVSVPERAVSLGVLDYESHQFGEARPHDGLVSDLLVRGETRGDLFVGGSALAFNRSAGDQVAYRFAGAAAAQAAVLLHYRMSGRAKIGVLLDGAASGELELRGDNDFHSSVLPVGALSAGEHQLRLISIDGAQVNIDGIVIAGADRIGEVRFQPEERIARPELIPGPVENSVIVKYPGLEQYYGIAWSFGNFQLREFLADDLDIFMRHRVHDHVSKVLKGEGDGHFTDAYLRPILLPPRESQVIHGLVCGGSREEVTRELAGFDSSGAACETAVEAARAKAALPRGTPSGRDFEFSQARMSATTLTNVVYPTYARRAYVRHNTPGRWWDSLYTWDSGFVALGLLELDRTRAADCLKAYLTEPGDPYAAFTHHGSPVPVQHYVYQQLWNRAQSRESLRALYPGLRQYHRFLSGRDPRSATRKLKSNLIQTWQHFYNSGGWDDYPAQKHVHQNRLTGTTATVINTAQAIRTAKILRMAARKLGLDADRIEYDEDIAVLTEALQTFAWDEEAGYFSYVRHTPEGAPDGFMRHESGANFNMGLDGVSPLVAGICTPEQQRRLIGHLGSERGLMTPIGLSTVDQSAPYYREDGYWNGAVWMPHQWFIWKALLDLGQPDLAFKIASTALKLWAAEVGNSYNCFEHFIVKTGRGAGWHHFGGLSTPVLCWFAAYYIPGRLNGGLDAWIDRADFADENTSLDAALSFDAGTGAPVALVAVMNPAHRYRAFWEGAEIPVLERSLGTLELVFKPGRAQGVLRIERT